MDRGKLILQLLKERFSVFKVDSAELIPQDVPMMFTAVTDEEVSVVCPERYVPAVTVERQDSFRGFRVKGTLEFSLIGILADLTGILAKAGIPVFAISTFNTDYVLIAQEHLATAISALTSSGYTTE